MSQRVRWFIYAACFAFLALTTAAMFVYPGGTFVNPDTHGYLFFENFFSDLGMTRSFSRADNTPAMFLFSAAMVCAGAGMILFFARFGAQFSAPRALVQAGAGCGILAGIAFFAIALTPQDLHSFRHDALTGIAVLFLLLAALMYAVVVARARHETPGYAVVFLVLALVLLANMLMYLFAPPLHTFTGMVIRATGQKIIVYSAMICLLLETRGTSRRKVHA